MNGWVDVVRIYDGEVILSKELRHVTGNITKILKTGNENEVMLATEKGVYFAFIGKGIGLMEVEMERFDKTLQKTQGLENLKVGDISEVPEDSSNGPKHTDLEGMS